MELESLAEPSSGPVAVDSAADLGSSHASQHLESSIQVAEFASKYSELD